MDEFEGFKLTEEQWNWFSQRMTETKNGVVTTSTYVLDKLIRLVGDETIPRWKAKAYLTQECYNKYSWRSHDTE